MSNGVVGFSTIGLQKQPSPSIWSDCPNGILTDKGLGYFAHEEFLGNTQIASLATKSVFGSGVLDIDCDAGVLDFLTGTTGGVAKFTTGGSDNNAIALFSPTLGTITLKSGNKLWAEANFQFAALGDEALAFGLTTEANATKAVIANDPSNSAVAALTAASFIGFVTQQTASAISKFDAKYAKSTGTPVVVLADVTNAVAIPLASRANLAATTDVKLGLYFNGRDKLMFFVNGYKVATQTVDATIDQTSNYVMVFNIKSGSAAAKTVSIDWIRYAYQNRF